MAKEFSSKGELVRMALEYALQDRLSMLAALSVDDEYRPQVKREIAEFRAYLKERFGAKDAEEFAHDRLASGEDRLVTLAEIRSNGDRK